MEPDNGSFCLMPDIQSWPPDHCYQMGKAVKGSLECIVLGHRDGSISMKVIDKGVLLESFKSQRIIIENKGLRIVIATWGVDSSPRIMISGNTLLPFSENLDPVQIRSVIHKNEEEGKKRIQELMNQIPDERDWKKWRRSHFESSVFSPDEELRQKTIFEQNQELKSAIVLLDSLIHNDTIISSAAIAAILRSLIFTKESPSRNYDALLLRLACFSDCDLKIHAYRISKEMLATLTMEVDGVFIFPNTPSIDPLEGNSFEMDLQEWLESPVCRARKTLNGITTDRVVSSKNLIFAASNKLGICHYDRSMPNELDCFSGISVSGINGMDFFLKKVALCVCHLGLHIISKYESNSQDDL